MANYRWSN